MPSFSVLAESEGFCFGSDGRRQQLLSVIVALAIDSSTKAPVQTSHWSLNRSYVPPSSGQKLKDQLCENVVSCSLFVRCWGGLAPPMARSPSRKILPPIRPHDPGGPRVTARCSLGTGPIRVWRSPGIRRAPTVIL